MRMSMVLRIKYAHYTERRVENRLAAGHKGIPTNGESVKVRCPAIVQDVILGGINLPARQDVFQDVPCALAGDIRNCAGNFDVGTLWYFLEPVQFTIVLPNEALAVPQHRIIHQNSKRN